MYCIVCIYYTDSQRDVLNKSDCVEDGIADCTRRWGGCTSGR